MERILEMKNREFYVFCRDNRKSADTIAKRNALQAVYDYMRECGTSKKGVQEFVEHQIYHANGRVLDIEAFQWMLSVFNGPSQNVSEEEIAGQMKLF